MTVTDIKVLKQTSNYRITLCHVSISMDGENLERLELKIKNKWVFVQNYYHFIDEKDFDEHSDALDHAKRFNPKQGWFKNYGHGNPLDQFKEIGKYQWSKDHSTNEPNFDKLANFTEMYKVGKNVYQFHGNHSKISAAFQFLIWDNKLKKDIEEILVKKYDGFVCKNEICEYTVIIKPKKEHEEFHQRVKERQIKMENKN